MARDPLEQPEEAIRRLYAYVAYRIGHGPDAEDVVSETIERALRYRDSYKPAAGTPIAWMIGIANRCLADAARSDPPAELREEDVGSGADFAGEVADRSELREALRCLEERERELVALRYGADLRAREIGELLAMRTNAVEVALHRALAKLREALGQA